MSARRQLCQDMRTHYFKVEGHKLFLSYSVAECTFSLLGKLEVAYAFTGTHRRTGGCTCCLLVPELTSYFNFAIIYMVWTLVFGAEWKPSPSLRKFIALKKFVCCSWKAFEECEMRVHLYINIQTPCSPLVRAVFGGYRSHHSSRTTRPVHSTFPLLSVWHTCTCKLGGKSGALIVYFPTCLSKLIWSPQNLKASLRAVDSFGTLCKKTICRNSSVAENHFSTSLFKELHKVDCESSGLGFRHKTSYAGVRW